MPPISRWVKNVFTRSPSPPRKFPSEGFKVISNAAKLEEEYWAWYTPSLFYPVRIGEVFQSRYQVLGKLGYGSRSTAWLSRDLRYVTLKVCELDSPPIRRELDAYRHLDTVTTSKSGALLIRELLDAFKVTGREGEHQCLVHEPLGMSMETLRLTCPGEKLPVNILKPFLIQLLLALDFLHTDAGIVHADIQTRNIHLRIEDGSILENFEQAELSDPSPRKIDADRVIYESRRLRRPETSGRPVLCDFGEARFGQSTYTALIQPHVYRAPEVTLGIPWTFSADIWNVGVMIWHIFENKHLFNARDGNGKESSLHRMAEMVALLGPPPPSFLHRGSSGTSKNNNTNSNNTSWDYFDNATGEWKGAVPIPDLSLERAEERLTDAEDRAMFLDLVRKMLRWVPEERPTARELLEHRWLRR